MPRKKRDADGPESALPPAEHYVSRLGRGDPGTWIDSARVDAAIERIFGGAPRLGREALNSEAA
jgi:hypothetical protein